MKVTRALLLLVPLLLAADGLAATGDVPATPPAPAAAPEPAPTPAEVRRLLARPPGSLAYGGTSGGRLEGAVKLPLRGKGWAFLPMVQGRGTHYGTSEMRGLLARVAARVREAHPKAVVGIGNVSLAEGGRSRWHVSHQTGRDVDIAMFYRDRRGRSINPRRFIGFGDDGHSKDRGKRYTFDVERNLTLVRALVEDPEVSIQWIFTSETLKELLLAEARRQEVPADTLLRLESTLHQPSDSLPHDDHFHVRHYCSVEDRLHGCLNVNPLWDWARLGDEPWEARIAQLERALEVESLALRLDVIGALMEIRARPAVPTLVAALEDSEPRIRYASLRALRAIRDPAALPGILGALSRADDPRWAARLFGSLLAMPTDAIREVAVGLLGEPGHYLHPAVAAGSLSDFHGTAIKILARYSRTEAIPTLIDLLDSEARSVRVAALDALAQVSNHAPSGSVATGSAARRRKVIERWKKLWEDHRDDPWLAWVRRGFERAGYRFAGALDEPRSLKVLVEALADKRPYVRANAVRALSELTGHHVMPGSRTPRRQQRHWRRWFEENPPALAAP